MSQHMNKCLKWWNLLANPITLVGRQLFSTVHILLLQLECPRTGTVFYFPVRFLSSSYCSYLSTLSVSSYFSLLPGTSKPRFLLKTQDFLTSSTRVSNRNDLRVSSCNQKNLLYEIKQLQTYTYRTFSVQSGGWPVAELSGTTQPSIFSLSTFRDYQYQPFI